MSNENEKENHFCEPINILAYTSIDKFVVG